MPNGPFQLIAKFTAAAAAVCERKSTTKIRKRALVHLTSIFLPVLLVAFTAYLTSTAFCQKAGVRIPLAWNMLQYGMCSSLHVCGRLCATWQCRTPNCRRPQGQSRSLWRKSSPCRGAGGRMKTVSGVLKQEGVSDDRRGGT